MERPARGVLEVTTDARSPGVHAVRLGPGGSCSAAGSAIDWLFYGSAAAGAALVVLRALVADPAPTEAASGDEAEREPPADEPRPAPPTSEPPDGGVAPPG